MKKISTKDDKKVTKMKMGEFIEETNLNLGRNVRSFPFYRYVYFIATSYESCKVTAAFHVSTWEEISAHHPGSKISIFLRTAQINYCNFIFYTRTREPLIRTLCL